MNCKKAECTVCHDEVSPDPEFGCFHYSPDSGSLLSFMPEYCPLYSNHLFPEYQAMNHSKNKQDCKICTIIKNEYPEYEILGELETHSRATENGWRYEQQDIFLYTCNLCDSKFEQVCEFDLHMRNHTKNGKNVAVIGLGISSKN